MALEIDKISFGNKLKELELKSYIESLAQYKGSLEKALSLEGDIPIFIDTNILLRYYSISFSLRRAFFDFLKKHQNRIILTSQVQMEFVKNREDIIERFFSETLTKLESNFQAEILNKVKSYIEQNKILLDDFPGFKSKLSQLKEDNELTQDELKSEISKVKAKLNETKYDDELLVLVQEMNLLESLSDEDIKYLKTEFDTLKKNIDASKIKSQISKPQNAFPGLADIIEKPENPYGDYLLFHEMVKYLQSHKTDAIFLTYDTAKGDWLRDNKDPHSHYVQIVYLSTGQNLFFVDAERFFDTHLHKNFNSLVPKRDVESINTQYAKEFLIKFIDLETNIRGIADLSGIDFFNSASLQMLIEELVKLYCIDKKLQSDMDNLIQWRKVFMHPIGSSVIDSLSVEEFDSILTGLHLAVVKTSAIYNDL